MNKNQKYHQSIIPGNGMAVKVVSRDINFALRAWKRKLKTSDILVDLKDNREYTKPSVTNRRKQLKAAYIQKLRTAEEQY